MSFDAVRQIVESRIFSVSYTTVSGDSLTSISSQFNKTTAQVTSFNTEVDFATGTGIIFSLNTPNRFANSRATGFAAGLLANDVSTLFFGGFGNTALAGTLNAVGETQLYATEAATNGSIEDKVLSWTSIINGSSLLGFTAIVTSNGLGIALIPKDGISNILTNGLTVNSTNPYGLSLVDTVAAGTVLNLGSTLSFPIFLEGRDFVQPTATGSNWAVLFINDSNAVGREFGNTQNGLRSSGSVRFQLYAPRNGTKLIREMADELNKILGYSAGSAISGGGVAGGTLFMKTGSLNRVSDDDDGRLSYNLDYIYDYYTS